MEEKTESVTVRLSPAELRLLRRMDRSGNVSRALRRILKIVGSIKKQDADYISKVLHDVKDINQQHIDIIVKFSKLGEFLDRIN